MTKLAKDETPKELKERKALEGELKKLTPGDPLPEGYTWGDNGALRNMYGRIVNGKLRTQKKMKDNMTLKEMLEKHAGKNINIIISKYTRIAKGLDPKATRMQVDALKHIIDLYFSKELKSKQVNHSLEISFDDQLLQIAQKTKEQKLLNETNESDIIDVEVEE